MNTLLARLLHDTSGVVVALFPLRLNRRALALFRLPKVILCLQAKPHIRQRTQPLRQTKRHVGRNAGATVDYLAQGDAGAVKRGGSIGKSHAFGESFDQYSAGVGRVVHPSHTVASRSTVSG